MGKQLQQQNQEVIKNFENCKRRQDEIFRQTYKREIGAV